MNISGIYKIQSKRKPERCYIGSAKNMARRWNRHLFDLKRNIHSNSKLLRHYKKYGLKDLQFSILVCCDSEDLIRNEQFFIDSYDPYFNILKIAGSQIGNKSTRGQSSHMKGKHHTEETKQKLREKRKFQDNKKLAESHKGQIPWNKGIPMTEEAKLKLSQSKKGKPSWNKGLHCTWLGHDDSGRFIKKVS